MKELEQIIIGGCFGEDQYRKVSFLEPDDFTNYPQKPYKEYFKLLKKSKANQDCLIESLKLCEDKSIYMLLCQQTNLLGANCIERYGLKLLETRFKALFINLLVKLSNESKNAVEVELLNESNMMVIRSDIFELTDYILEYLGAHASDYTKNRIKSFLSYRDKRVEQAKQIINEFR